MNFGTGHGVAPVYPAGREAEGDRPHYGSPLPDLRGVEYGSYEIFMALTVSLADGVIPHSEILMPIHPAWGLAGITGARLAHRATIRKAGRNCTHRQLHVATSIP